MCIKYFFCLLCLRLLHLRSPSSSGLDSVESLLMPLYAEISSWEQYNFFGHSEYIQHYYILYILYNHVLEFTVYSVYNFSTEFHHENEKRLPTYGEVVFFTIFKSYFHKKFTLKSDYHPSLINCDRCNASLISFLK